MGKKPRRLRTDRRDVHQVRWRTNRIATWRKRAGETWITQQGVADALGEAGIALDRVSIVRIESGKQMPSIGVLEAIAHILKAPHIHALINLTPDQAKEIEAFERLKVEEKRRILRLVAAFDDDESIREQKK